MMDIFLEGLNIFISTFCVCADGFQGLSKAFHYIQLLTFYLLLLTLIPPSGGIYDSQFLVVKLLEVHTCY